MNPGPLVIATLVNPSGGALSIEAAAPGSRIISCASVAHFGAVAGSARADLLVYQVGFDGRPSHPGLPAVLAAATCPVLVILRGAGAPAKELVELATGEHAHIDAVIGASEDIAHAIAQLTVGKNSRRGFTRLIRQFLRNVPKPLHGLFVCAMIAAEGSAKLSLFAAIAGLARRTIQRRFAEHHLTPAKCLHAMQVAVALYRYLELGWKTSDVVAEGSFPDASSLRHRIKQYSGRSTREWRRDNGGVEPALEAVVRILLREPRAGGGTPHRGVRAG